MLTKKERNTEGTHFIGNFAVGNINLEESLQAINKKRKTAPTKIRVTDPCYSRDTWCTSVQDNCLVGVWSANVVLKKESGWGMRVSELIITHESFGTLGATVGEIDHRMIMWEGTDQTIGVDSGQAGFFDDSFYPDKKDNGEFEDPRSFYGACCKITLDGVAGVIPFGCVSSSGYGDGSYSLYVHKNKDNNIDAMKLVFIGEDEENIDEYDEEDE